MSTIQPQPAATSPEERELQRQRMIAQGDALLRQAEQAVRELQAAMLAHFKPNKSP